MNKIAVTDAVKAANGALIRRGADNFISGVKHDSRECGAGDLFVAIIGENMDGHQFIPQVVEKGCRTVMVSHEDGWTEAVGDVALNVILVEDTVYALGELAKYYLQTLDVLKIAVTGSVGKTSVRDMIYYVLREKYVCGRNLKNFNNAIGVPISIFQFDSSIQAVVLELGMNQFGEIDRLAEIVKPHIAVITNIGISHIENLGSRDGIFQAKMEITKHITGRGEMESGALVFPFDDEYLTKENTKGSYQQIVIGEDGRSEYIISSVDDFGLLGIQFTLEHKQESCRITLSVPGRHNAVNAALAIAAGGLAGVTIKQAQRGLSKAELTGSRLKQLTNGRISVIDDTYNASPDSMKSAMKVLEISECKGHKIAILGDMYELGTESKRQHFGIGLFARNLRIDTVIAIGEDAAQIAEGAEGGQVDVAYFKNKEAFYAKMGQFIGIGDIILVKGSRGMKMEKVVEKLLEF